MPLLQPCRLVSPRPLGACHKQAGELVGVSWWAFQNIIRQQRVDNFYLEEESNDSTEHCPLTIMISHFQEVLGFSHKQAGELVGKTSWPGRPLQSILTKTFELWRGGTVTPSLRLSKNSTRQYGAHNFYTARFLLEFTHSTEHFPLPVMISYF